MLSVSNIAAQASRRLLLAGCLVVLLLVAMPTTALASAPGPDGEGVEQCAQCHADQAEMWINSPHGQADDSHVVATCETCHGSYISGHPQEGLMQVQSEASCCKDCHTETYDQWHETAHADSDVQCAGCHTVHTQETRLTSEELCLACHREVTDDVTHHNVGVHCVDCHVMSPAELEMDTSDDVRIKSGSTTPNHSFQPAGETCQNCHGQIIHTDTDTFNISNEQETQQMLEVTNRARDLSYELEKVKKDNRSLQAMSVVSLGLGLGVGGVLGIILVSVVCNRVQKKVEG